MATTPEGRRRHTFTIDYDKGWSIEELENWLEQCRALGAKGSATLRARYKGTLGPSGFAGLEVLLPLPARDAGSSTDEPEEEGGVQYGETSS